MITFSLTTVVGVGLVLSGIIFSIWRTIYVRKNKIYDSLFLVWLFSVIVIPLFGMLLIRGVSTSYARAQKTKQLAVIVQETAEKSAAKREERRQEQSLKYEKRDAERKRAYECMMGGIPEEWTPIRALLSSHRLRGSAKMELVGSMFRQKNDDLPEISINQQWHMIEIEFACKPKSDYDGSCTAYRDILSRLFADYIDFTISDDLALWELKNVEYYRGKI